MDTVVEREVVQVAEMVELMVEEGKAGTAEVVVGKEAGWVVKESQRNI